MYHIKRKKKQYVLDGHTDDYRVDALSKSYLTTTEIQVSSLKSIRHSCLN